MDSIRNSISQTDLNYDVKISGRGSDEFLISQKSKLRDLSESFESLLTNEIFKSMRKVSFSNDEDGPFSVTKEEEIFTSMLDSEVAEMASHKDPYGLSEMVYESLMPALEGWHSAIVSQLETSSDLEKENDRSSLSSSEDQVGMQGIDPEGFTDQFIDLSRTLNDFKSKSFNDKVLDNKGSLDLN